MWNYAYLVSLQDAFKAKSSKLIHTVYNEEKNEIQGRYDSGEERSYDIDSLSEKTVDYIVTSHRNSADISVMSGYTVSDYTDWVFLALERARLAKALQDWKYKEGVVTYRLNGEPYRVTADSSNYPKLVAIEVLWQGYTYKEVPFSHYEISKKGGKTAATFPYRCSCEEYEQEGACAHLYLVQTLLSMRRELVRVRHTGV